MQDYTWDEIWLNVFENLDDAIVIVRPDGEILYTNPANLKYFDLAAHNFVGRSFGEFVNILDLRKFERALRSAVAGEIKVSIDIQTLRADGREDRSTMYMTRLSRRDGFFIPTIAIFLRNLEPNQSNDLAMRLLASIVDGSQDAIIGKTLDGVIISWNAAATALFGYTAEQAIGRSITMLFPFERISDEAEIIARISRGEKVHHYEAKRLAKDGGVLDLSITVSPIRDATGRVVGASKIARNMGDERRRNDRLAVLASVYENCGEAIMILNAKGDFVEVNASFTAITGFAGEEMIGQSYNSFRSGRQSPEEARRMIRDLRRNGICKGEIWTRRKDGSALAGFVTVTALPRAASESRYIAIFRDYILEKAKPSDILRERVVPRYRQCD